MKSAEFRKAVWSTVAWVALALAVLGLDFVYHNTAKLPSGIRLLQLLTIGACIPAAAGTLSAATYWMLAHRNRPAVEATMINRLYRVAAILALIAVGAYGFGKLTAFGSFFTLFGGMLLGWSLQAPVSGFAAWILVSLKRPFRPGDRVQFPSLALTGDIKEIGPMYTMLDQVGGTVGSEEAVGRFILVPNAMLFSQVVINYTVTQEAAYMLDEAIVRITYDSHWDTAEKILLDAATQVTGDIIQATGTKPYVRADLYDYGVYLRLRYQTHVQDRTEIAYKITKLIFEGIQRTRQVDLAIPYVYSYRAGSEKRDGEAAKSQQEVTEIDVNVIHGHTRPIDPHDVQQVADSIATHGLLQPIMVTRNPHGGEYDIVAGDLRLEACKRLGWRTIPALVVDGRQNENRNGV